MRAPEELMVVLQYVVSVWAAAIVFFDVRTRRIPNELTLGAWLFSAVVLLMSGRGALGAAGASCLTAAALGVLLTVPAYVLRMLGGGDVKLMAAIGLTGGLPVLVVSFVVGGLLAGAMVLVHFFRGGNTQKQSGSSVEAESRERRLRPIPFGAALAAGLLCAIYLPMDWLAIPSMG